MNYRSAAHEAIAKGSNLHGYIPDSDDRRRQQKDASLLLVSAGDSQASLTSYECDLFDQGPFGSCTGHGTAMIVRIALAAMGYDFGPVPPSPWMFYVLARILARAVSSIALTDSGAMPTDLLTVCRLYGVEPMVKSTTNDGRFSDCDSTNINAEPGLLDLERSALKLLTGEYRIDEQSPNMGAQITSSLSQKVPGGIGIFVDTAFENWDPASGPISSINLSDSEGGGHWLALDYHYTTPAGVLVLGGPNSWGKDWPNGSGVPGSPFWSPGHYEITYPCLQKAASDVLLFPCKVLS